jgi:hypothetical protein
MGNIRRVSRIGDHAAAGIIATMEPDAKERQWKPNA